jgi:hypothetical protein
MVDCYHAECDDWNQDTAKPENYKFLTSTAQSVVLSLAELAMERGRESGDCIEMTVKHIVAAASKTSTTSTTTTTTTSTTSTTTTTTTSSTTTATATTILPTLETVTSLPADQVVTSFAPKNALPADELLTLLTPKMDNSMNEIYDMESYYQKGDHKSELVDFQALLRQELSKLLQHQHQQQQQQHQQQQQQQQQKHSQFARMSPNSIGTQINIQNLNLNLSNDNDDDDDKQCRSNAGDQLDDQGLVLGSGHVDYDVLSNVVRNFYGDTDRRKYKGKNQNSPMVIKFLEKKK